MTYAIFHLFGKQYKVKEGDLIEVDKTFDKDQKTVVIDKILLASDGDKLLIGTPYIADVKIEAINEGSIRGPKIDIVKFRAKSRYTRQAGSRSKMTSLRIAKITIGGKTTSKTETQKPEVKPKVGRPKKTDKK